MEFLIIHPFDSFNSYLLKWHQKKICVSPTTIYFRYLRTYFLYIFPTYVNREISGDLMIGFNLDKCKLRSSYWLTQNLNSDVVFFFSFNSRNVKINQLRYFLAKKLKNIIVITLIFSKLLCCRKKKKAESKMFDLFKSVNIDL